MLYVSDKDEVNYIVSDTESDKRFYIMRRGFDIYSCDALGEVHEVLGYFDRDFYVVPKELVGLLGYVDYVRYISCVGDMDVSLDGIATFDKYRVFMRIDSGNVYSLLDVLMCASYDKIFNTYLEMGVLPCGFGNSSLYIHLCGNYKFYVSKLVTLYRDKWYSLDKADIFGLK